MFNQRSSLQGYFLILGVLCVQLVNGNTHNICDCMCSSKGNIHNVCQTASNIESITNTNSEFLADWKNDLFYFRDWFEHRKDHLRDFIDEMIPHIDKKLRELVPDKISPGNEASSTVEPDAYENPELDVKETIMNLTKKLQEVEDESSKTKDDLAARINEVESTSLQARNEFLLRIKDAEKSLQEKGELLDQLREREKELKDELATERRVREQLEETIMKLTRKLQEVEYESSKTKDELAARINEVESTSLQARNELLLRINDAERSLQEKGELLDQVREREKELKHELATERRVREQLEENLRKTQEVVSSLIASQNATFDAIQKNIDLSAENIAENIYEMGNLNKKLDDFDAAVKDCASSQSLSMLDERLRNLSEKTDTVVDNFTREISPHLQELDEKIEVVEAALNASLGIPGSSIAEIWSHLKVQSLRGSPQLPYTPCPTSSTEWVEGPGVFCYLFETRRKLNWTEANRDCLTKGGALFDIYWKERDFVKNHTRSLTNAIWTHGARFSGDGDAFTWVDGKECFYSNEKKKEKNNFGEIQECYQEDTVDWEYSEIPCDTKQSYVCWAQKAKLSSYHNTIPEKICPNTTTDWVDLGTERCYLFILRSTLDWYEVNFDCQMKGGELASIHSETEHELLRPHLKSVPYSLYIGLHRSLSDNDRFEWLDGSEFNYSNLEIGEPTEYDECGSFSPYSKKWTTSNCYDYRGYICSALKIPVIRKLPYAPCPASSTEWVEGNGEWCYLFETRRHLGWEEANYQCMKKGGALVIIHSEEEKDFLYNHTRSMPETFWIGLRKSYYTTPYYERIDGRGCRYSNWMENELKDCRSGRCVEIQVPSMKMKFADCDTEKAYICAARKAKLD